MFKRNLQAGFSGAIIIAVVALAIIVGGVIYYQSSQNKEETVMADEAMDEAMMEEANMEVGEEATEDENKEGGAGMMEDGGEMMMDGELSFSGEVLAGNQTKLLDYNQADFKKAKASDKLIVLYYYANWCPICREEVQNSLYPAFNELKNENVIGFRINYNDNQTDDNERDLAREHGVAYQHAKVFLKNGERVLKSPESWEKSRYFEEIERYTN